MNKLPLIDKADYIDFITILRAGMDRYRNDLGMETLVEMLEEWCEKTEDELNE